MGKYTVNDTKYTQVELAEEIGISVSTLKSRLKTMTAQEAYDAGDNKYVLNGKKYSSKIALSKEIGISVTTLRQRMKTESVQEIYDSTVAEKYVINGKTYSNKKEIAKEIGISPAVLNQRLETMTIQEAYDMGNNKLCVDGKEYTQKDLAHKMGISLFTLRARLKTMTAQEAYDLGNRRIRNYEVDGIIFDTTASVADHFGIDRDVLWYTVGSYRGLLAIKEVVTVVKLKAGFICVDNEFVHVSDISEATGMSQTYIIEHIKNGGAPHGIPGFEFYHARIGTGA